MDILELDKKVNKQITKDFSISDFSCTGGDDCACSTTKHDPLLSVYLQRITDHFGKEIRITSGYRCEVRNAEVGGVSQSKHKSGQAADIKIDGVSSLEIAKYAESIGIKGIGYYDPSHDNFVHIDTRTTKSYWKNTSSNSVSTFGGEYNESEANSMVCIFDSGMMTATTYTADDVLAKLYVVTCSVGGGTPYRTMVIPKDVYSEGSVATIKIEGAYSFVTMNYDKDSQQATFRIVNSNNETCYLKHIVAFY